jgi:hypothetical protein
MDDHRELLDITILFILLFSKNFLKSRNFSKNLNSFKLLKLIKIIIEVLRVLPVTPGMVIGMFIVYPKSRHIRCIPRYAKDMLWI